MTSALTPPPGLRRKGRGRALWDEVMASLELDQHEEALLVEAARTLDLLDRLDRIIRRDGPLAPDGHASAAVVESRQQRLVYARLIASLRLPPDLSQPMRRPQRRGAARGTYDKPLSLVRKEGTTS
jgi:hypothetical protein